MDDSAPNPPWNQLPPLVPNLGLVRPWAHGFQESPNLVKNHSFQQSFTPLYSILSVCWNRLAY